MTKPANHYVNLDNIIDAIDLNKTKNPVDIPSAFGITDKRFKHLMDKIGKRLKSRLGDDESAATVIAEVMRSIKDYKLNDTEALSTIAHTFLNMGFGRGVDWQQEEDYIAVLECIERLGLWFLLPEDYYQDEDL